MVGVGDSSRVQTLKDHDGSSLEKTWKGSERRPNRRLLEQQCGS